MVGITVEEERHGIAIASGQVDHPMFGRTISIISPSGNDISQIDHE